MGTGNERCEYAEEVHYEEEEEVGGGCVSE
jgi:hypothetical protein